MDNKYGKLIAKIKKAQNIAIFMHINPDCDCIGSAISLYKFLQKDGKNVCFFSPDLSTDNMIADRYKFLPGIEFMNKSTRIAYFDLSIGVDMSDATRLGDVAFRQFIRSSDSLVIDHHAAHKDFAKYTWREDNAASTTQILYKIMKEYNESLIDRDIATLLYAGLVADSGCFSFDCVTSESHLVAAELLKYGVDANVIAYRLIRETTINAFRLKNRVLEKTKFYENGRIAIVVFRLEDFQATDTNENDSEGVINSLQDVDSVDLAISIAEVADKKYKLSFRSKNNVNAAACAKCFGGGGHYRAAGCRLYGYYEDVYDKVLSMAKEMIYND